MCQFQRRLDRCLLESPRKHDAIKDITTLYVYSHLKVNLIPIKAAHLSSRSNDKKLTSTIPCVSINSWTRAQSLPTYTLYFVGISYHYNNQVRDRAS